MRLVSEAAQSIDEASAEHPPLLLRPGGCSVSFVPPDICIGRYVGNVTAEDAAAMFAELRRLARDRPYVFTLVDISRAANIATAAKKLASQSTAGLVVRGTAMVGANLRMRLVVRLMTRAMNLMSRLSDNPVRCFDSDAEALVWLAELRAQIPPP